MDLQFRFRESTLKHGVTEGDIRHAFENYRVIKQFENRENLKGDYYETSFHIRFNCAVF